MTVLRYVSKGASSTFLQTVCFLESVFSIGIAMLTNPAVLILSAMLVLGTTFSLAAGLGSKGALAPLYGGVEAGRSGSTGSGHSLSDNKPLTIESAIQNALVQNPELAIVRDKLRIAREALELTDSLFRPHVSFYTELATGDSPSVYLLKSIDQRQLPPDVILETPGVFNNIESGFKVRWNLYKGGVDSLAIRMAQSDIREKKAMTEQVENLVLSSVIQLFFSQLKAREYSDIARQSVETLQEQLRVMNLRFTEGGVLKSDLLSLEVRLADAKRDLILSRSIYSTNLTALNVLLGRRPDSGVELAKSCESPMIFPGSYHEAVVIAMEKRPEVLRAKEMLQQARLEFKKAGAGYLPQVDLNARWYIDSDTMRLNGSNNNYIAALVMNWDLYTGQSTESDLAIAGYALDLARKNMKKTELDIFQDVKRAYLNHEDALQRFEVADKTLKMADEALSLVRKRYEGGAESVTRYLEAELARNRSRMNKTAAFYDEKIAESDIAVSMGILSQLWKP